MKTDPTIGSKAGQRFKYYGSTATVPYETRGQCCPEESYQSSRIICFHQWNDMETAQFYRTLLFIRNSQQTAAKCEDCEAAEDANVLETRPEVDEGESPLEKRQTASNSYR